LEIFITKRFLAENRFMTPPLEGKQKAARKRQNIGMDILSRRAVRPITQSQEVCHLALYAGTLVLATSISLDYRELFGWQYPPNLDPLFDHLSQPIPSSYISANVVEHIRAEGDI
jgi:hypothetical protein